MQKVVEPIQYVGIVWGDKTSLSPLGRNLDWGVPSHHNTTNGATMLTTRPGAQPMIDPSY